MPDVITEYQRWKQQGDDLRSKAKQAMETRYKELLAEAIHLAEEYRADFGSALKPPPAVTSFRYKAGAKKVARKAAAKAVPAVKPATPAKSVPAAKAAEPAAAPVTNPSAKVIRLQKRLEAAKKKLEAAKAAGAPTKNLEDKVYEIGDELQLSTRT